jgi:KaiC/GvpD/RAD55 family RecA-like ATPase
MSQNTTRRQLPEDPDYLVNGVPADASAERFLLGCILVNAERWLPSIRAGLHPSDLCLDTHQTIYRRVVDIAERNEPVDRITLANELGRHHKELEGVGGLSYLSKLDADGTFPANLTPTYIEGYIRRVQKASRRRRLVFAAEAVRNRALINDDEPIETLLTAAAESFRSLATEGPKAILLTHENVPPIWEYESTVNYIIEDFLPEGCITLLTGDSGHGKTLFATAIAGAIATGGEFLGRQAVQRRALYLDRENPLSLAKQHLFDLHIGPTPNLTYWGGWCQAAANGPASASLHEFARAEKPVMVFDSLVAFHDGNEQDASETRRYLQRFRDLADAGATIILLHHTGKSETSKQYRGSSDIKAAVDMGWLVQKMGDDPAGKLVSLRLVPFKNRIGAASVIPLSFTDGRFVNDTERVETNREIFERVIRTHPRSKAKELMELGKAAGISKHRIEELIQQGLREGWLQVTRTRNVMYYSLAEPTLGEI